MPDGTPRLGMRVRFSPDFYITRLIPTCGWTGIIRGITLVGASGLTRLRLILNSERLKRPKSTLSRKKWNLTTTNEKEEAPRETNNWAHAVHLGSALAYRHVLTSDA
jgi:hypothetical protein